ncbi:MAG: FAD-dependent oxidoreductase [Verrucomicrobia bacterium]|nr:FAD-dependent oxidoreductase [Verrucomicrobiota bacterium]
MGHPMSRFLAALLAGLTSLSAADSYDVCVYGGNASGVMAACAAAKEGAKVVVVEPSRWLGGMTGGGLMHIDWGREEAVSGSTRRILKKDYKDAQYRSVFAEMLKAAGVTVLFEHRVSAVEKSDGMIRAIALDLAPFDDTGCPPALPMQVGVRTIKAKVFIDCSYEGDLMARSGVAYTFGREAKSAYGESLAGAQPPMSVYAIDPYVRAGDPQSGLLPGLQPTPVAPVGEADKLTMGYGFRWRFVFKGESLPIEPPANYDPKQFELYRRAFQQGVDILSGRVMRGKVDGWEKSAGRVYSGGAGNLARALFAPTNYGHNAGYPDGDYATRARIWKEQQDFVRGLTHFLRTDPSVPAKQREIALGVGLEKGAFDDTKGYPHQLYVREARRMVSDYVVTQKDLEGRTNPVDSVGLASYGVDEWPYATVALDGKVALMGGYYSMLYLEDDHRGIYRIPYRAIVPRKDQCANLLVPVCVSASHVAMTSIRMEPVWMILGESAGVAAAMAVKSGTAVQDVPYAELHPKLRALAQKVEVPKKKEPRAK